MRRPLSPNRACSTLRLAPGADRPPALPRLTGPSRLLENPGKPRENREPVPVAADRGPWKYLFPLLLFPVRKKSARGLATLSPALFRSWSALGLVTLSIRHLFPFERSPCAGPVTSPPRYLFPFGRSPHANRLPWSLVALSHWDEVRARTGHLVSSLPWGEVRGQTGYLGPWLPYPIGMKSVRRTGHLVSSLPWGEVRARTAPLFPWSLKSQGDFGRTLDESRQGREGGWLRCERSRSSR